jgi:hypothetical protein
MNPEIHTALIFLVGDFPPPNINIPEKPSTLEKHPVEMDIILKFVIPTESIQNVLANFMLHVVPDMITRIRIKFSLHG